MIISSKKRYGFFGEETHIVHDWLPYPIPLVNLPELSKQYSNILLQVDGGGILGVMTAYHLYNIEFKQNVKINDVVKTYWGCSTGSIICALLNIGISAQQILQWYIEKGPHAFAENPGFLGLFGAMYKTEYLENELKTYFKDITFKELYEQSGKDLNIMVVNCTKECHEVWNWETKPDVPVWVGIRGSMAAPIYFPAYEYQGEIIADGGTGSFTCTTEKAFNKEIYVKDNPIKDMYILSFGCGRTKIGMIDKNRNLQKALWVFKYARKESVEKQEQFLAYRKEDDSLNYTRWNIDLTKELASMNNTDNIPELIKLLEK